MFIYSYAVLQGVRFTVAERVLGDLLAGLPEVADVAYRHGEELRARVGPRDGRIAKTIRLDVGEPVRGEGQVRVPLAWEATGTPGIFPRMEASLIVSAMGPETTHLAFQGTYRPPMGALGRALDRAGLHRVAEASVKAFVDRLADSLKERVALIMEGGEGDGALGGLPEMPGVRI